MGLIPDNKVAEIRDRIDIVAVISEHVPLRRAGVNHLGLCPFHAEKTPSFNVNQAKQFFYCFGCQKSGDVFRFLMELEGRNFAEVARDLARRAGVDIPETTEGQSPQMEQRRRQQLDERARLLRLQDIAAAWFEAQLGQSDKAQHYLTERGIGPDIVKRFRLGYAPDAWDGLLQILGQKRVPHELAERSGLLIRRERAQMPQADAPAQKTSHYDRFRDRIIFPLININGDVIAFGGRVLPGEADGKEGAKYINSPESPLYKKGDNLYGLHAAKDGIRRGRQVVLVEGNFDVLALHQHGIDNAVAPMGTALTDTQVRLLKRLLSTDGHVVLMLDGDRAGRAATMKDIALFSQSSIDDMALFTGSEIDLRVVQLPDGEDPDTYAAFDPPGMQKRIKNAKPAVDYVLDEAIKLAEHDNVAGKAKVLMQVAPLLLSIKNPTTMDMYVDRLADSLALDPKLVWRHVRSQPPAQRTASQGPTQPQAPPPAPPRERPHAAARPVDPIELKLVSLCATHPQLFAVLPDNVLDRLDDPAIAEMLREARDLAGSGEQPTIQQLLELSPPELRDAVASAVLEGRHIQAEHPDLALTAIGVQIRARSIQRELNELKRALARAFQAGDQKRVQELMVRTLELQQMPELRLFKEGQSGPQA